MDEVPIFHLGSRVKVVGGINENAVHETSKGSPKMRSSRVDDVHEA